MGEEIESWCVGVGEVKGELWQGGDKSGLSVKYWEKEVSIFLSDSSVCGFVVEVGVFFNL